MNVTANGFFSCYDFAILLTSKIQNIYKLDIPFLINVLKDNFKFINE